MKKLLGICCGLFFGGALQAQTFEKNWILPTAENLSSIQMEWVSLDRDTLLDLVLVGKATDGQLRIITYQNQNASTLIKKATLLTGLKEGTIQLADWNKDNRVDVLIAGVTLINTDVLFVFENKADFTFQKNADKLLEHTGMFRIVDVTQDGREDVIATGIKNNTSFLSIFRNEPGNLVKVYDSLNLFITDIVSFDFNRDGKNDFAISGKSEAKAITLAFLNQTGTHYKVVSLTEPVDGKLSVNDHNSDGWMDLYAIGTNQQGQSVNQIWKNNQDSFTALAAAPSPSSTHFFTGDFSSDGFIDRLELGKEANGKKANFILDSAFNKTELDTSLVIAQRAGDFDRDGDLDILQVTDSLAQNWLRMFENTTTTENERPGNPTNGFAISAFNKTFLFWQSPKDDHTATPSITYDVWLGKDGVSLINLSFNLTNFRRMTVSHGNAGTNTGLIVNGLTDDRYYYLIQSVDNAYNGSYGICTGGVLPCFDLMHEDVQACQNNEVQLTANSTAFWFSTTKGFLGSSSELKFTASANDTIFSFVPQGSDCAKNKVWVINVREGPESEQETIFVCEAKATRIGIEPGWQSVTWNLEPPVLNADTIQFVPTREQIIIVTAQAQGGCPFQKEFTIKLSKPQLQLNGEVFQIIKGGSVQLEAIGTVEQFFWEPAGTLNDNTISNPVATPPQTTEYVVTATDSVGCSLTAKVLIQVEESAFVPNLFTPNGDGKNDVLTIYGLTQANAFQFQIFNREGNLVYETSDLRQASSSGWNGFAGGTRQPSGVYYWKVDGKSITGQRLLLNGKKTGSILLVH